MMSKTRKTKLKELAMAAVMTAAIAVMSQLSVPLPSGIPLTLQIFSVSLGGYLCGPIYGTAACTVYITLGAVGLPVFYGFSGGIGHILSPSGGFLLGFLPVAALCGVGTVMKKKLPAVTAGLGGLLLCHLIGVIWFAKISFRTMADAFILASLPYLLKDIILVISAYLFANLIRSRMINQKSL